MKNYLVQWVHNGESDGEFTLHTSWWKKDNHSLWAAIRAESDFHAEEIIKSSYTSYAYDTKFISITEQDEDWIPSHVTNQEMHYVTCLYSI